MKDKLKIVKIGGNVIDDERQLSSFLDYFSALEGCKLLVHGGGRKATELANALGVPTQMVSGRRITDEKGLEIVTMVYAGLLNKKIVAGLQARGCNALGLTGADANSIMAHKRTGSEIDYGFAGDIDQVDSVRLGSLILAGLTPVFCAITHDGNGQLLNTNADTIASELAQGLCVDFEVELVYCFEKDGVLEDLDDEASVVGQMDFKKFQKMKSEGAIFEGMLPKLDNSFNALRSGVARVIIGKPELLRDMDRKHTVLTL
jgi:acetylglutamate kinase